MIFFASFLTMLILIGDSAEFFSPEFKHEVSLEGEPLAHCRPPTDQELVEYGIVTEGRSEGFKLSRFFFCERDIFEYGDRDSYETFVANHIGQRAKEVATKIAKQQRLEDPWRVRIDFSEAAQDLSGGVFSERLREIFLSELAKALGPDRVSRLVAPSHYAPSLQVRVYRVSDPESFVESTILIPTGGKKVWQSL